MGNGAAAGDVPEGIDEIFAMTLANVKDLLGFCAKAVSYAEKS